MDRHTTRERAARTFKGLPAKVNEKIYKMELNIEYMSVQCTNGNYVECTNVQKVPKQTGQKGLSCVTA